MKKKINKASTYRQQAENLLNEFETTLAQARLEAQDQHKEKTHDITADIAKKKKGFLDKLGNRLHLSEQDLYRERVKTKSEIKTLPVEVAALVLGKVTGRVYRAEELLKSREKI